MVALEMSEARMWTPPTFTPRELEVLRAYALGHSWDRITEDMGIARTTLSVHWQHIMQKTPGAQCHVDVLRLIGWLRVP
jgi:DNA-binding NarL/FixJ family response regulator